MDLSDAEKAPMTHIFYYDTNSPDMQTIKLT